MSPETFQLRPGYVISRIIKGGWQLAGGHGVFDRDAAVSDMAEFVDAGIVTFDCADIYTGVEAMIGDAIRLIRNTRGDDAARRVQVHTKLVPDLSRLDSFTQQDVRAIVDRSLKRLGVEQLDLVQFFWWDISLGNPIETLGALKQLRDEGKIKHLGVTNWDEAAMAGFVDNDFALVSAQVQYSLLDARPEGAFTHWCQQRDIHIICYGVLAGGFISDTWLGQSDPGFEFENRSLIKYRLIIEEFGGWDLFQTLLDRLHHVAERHHVTIAAIASRYMLDQPQVGAVIIGARTARNLDATLQPFTFQLTQRDIREINAVLEQRSGPAGTVYALERDRTGPHGRIMKYNLNAE